MCYAGVYPDRFSFVTSFLFMQKILFVCLGNICRSPMAEAIFNHKISELGLKSHFLADSCGTSNYHIGDLPDPRTLKNARQNGVAIQHRGRQLAAADLDHFDWIFAMDRSNHHNILALAREEHQHKIHLMRSWDPQPDSHDVPDPYYGEDRDFQEVFEILSRSIDAFLDDWKSKR
jgi:protein-tyrosine phosphatase